MIMRVLAVALLFLAQSVLAQWNNWRDAASVLQNLQKAQAENKVYFSQFHVYDARSKGDIFSSKFKRQTGEELFIYGLDFYYASGTYYDADYRAFNRKNVIDIVKTKWRENRAIPSFSWHLENPYVPKDFGKSMGCRYRYSDDVPNYPEQHRYVIKEILENGGPAEWFDARVREVAGIINELVDDNGEPIPMIIRLWHEMEDNWMWWGSKSVSASDYKKFFIFTEQKIKQYAPKAQILWGYGPDSYLNSERKFMKFYPGDEYVDIIGYDDYQLDKPDKFDRELAYARMVTEIAKKRGKVAAMFETANKNPETVDDYLATRLTPLLTDSLVHFGLVQFWSSGKFENESQYADRRNFLNQSFILKVK